MKKIFFVLTLTTALMAHAAPGDNTAWDSKGMVTSEQWRDFAKQGMTALPSEHAFGFTVTGKVAPATFDNVNNYFQSLTPSQQQYIQNAMKDVKGYPSKRLERQAELIVNEYLKNQGVKGAVSADGENYYKRQGKFEFDGLQTRTDAGGRTETWFKMRSTGEPPVKYFTPEYPEDWQKVEEWKKSGRPYKIVGEETQNAEFNKYKLTEVSPEKISFRQPGQYTGTMTLDLSTEGHITVYKNLKQANGSYEDKLDIKTKISPSARVARALRGSEIDAKRADRIDVKEAVSRAGRK
ncbi:MAG: hypothetical protein JSU04_08365 [Bdellovibrionales bacterium]|nr:hypothetical protein [Bdellovibrionales bacterium]